VISPFEKGAWGIEPARTMARKIDTNWKRYSFHFPGFSPVGCLLLFIRTQLSQNVSFEAQTYYQKSEKNGGDGQIFTDHIR